MTRAYRELVFRADVLGIDPDEPHVPEGFGRQFVNWREEYRKLQETPEFKERLQKTLDTVDRAAKEMRFRDKQRKLARDAGLPFHEWLNRTCKQIRGEDAL